MCRKSAGRPWFLHAKPGSCSFCSRSPRGTTHKGQESLLLPRCKGQCGTVTCSNQQASARAASGRAHGPQRPAQPQNLQQKYTQRRKRHGAPGPTGQETANAFRVTHRERWDMSVHSCDSVSPTQHTGFLPKCSLTRSPSSGTLQTDKASPILAALPNINHLCHLWSCHLLIKIPPQLHAIWRCPLGSAAQYKAICYVMLPDSELPALVSTGNEALEIHNSVFAKYRPWTLIFCLWMTTHNDNSMLGIT